MEIMRCSSSVALSPRSSQFFLMQKTGDKADNIVQQFKQCSVITYSSVILLINLDGLIGFSCEQSTATVVETALEDPRLAVQGSRLNRSLNLLKVVASLPVPEIHATIVT